ncbi:MAG: terminase [Phenylobacterium sp.]|uniref:phage terminase large subunit family protein n=1 Tax=Phenylobacterium sp. TaxID=1871053 RepID=UPI00260AADE2|nr:hypothetical protein [Phenylobacterium sp.]MDB5497292.1 terminase [Phenylobacterium sp.]
MNAPYSQDLFDALLREDLCAFVHKAFEHLEGNALRPGRHIELFASEMRLVYAGETLRLVLNAPPRSLKSFVAVVATVAWVLGKWPGFKVMIVTHDERLGLAHTEKIRKLLQADWYQRACPGTRLDPDHNRAGDFQTTAGGHVFARSLESGTTGHGADWIIIDDPLDAGVVQSAAARDRAYGLIVEKFASRLNSQAAGAIVLVMQRLHPDDVAGQLLEGGGFKHVVVQQIAETETTYLIDGKPWVRPVGDVLDPDNWGEAGLERYRRQTPTFVWLSQYQQTPVSPSSGFIEERFFTPVEVIPALPFETFLSFDLAGGGPGETGSYSVCAVIHRHDQNYYISQIWRGRPEFEALKAKAMSLIHQHRSARVLIEDAALGPALISSLRPILAGRLVVIPRPSLSKVDRVLSVFDILADRRVHLPMHEPWVRDFVDEAVQFPGGSHDDQLDAVVQCLRWLRQGANSPPSPFAIGGPAHGHGRPHPQRDPRQRHNANMMPRPRFAPYRNPRPR